MVNELYLSAAIPAATAALVRLGAGLGPAKAVMMYSERRRSLNYWPDRHGNSVRLVVWHISQGTAESAINWLCDPASDASSNDVIDRLGTCHNLVAGKDGPWTNGPKCNPNMRNPLIKAATEMGVNLNDWSYTIECAGYSSEFKGGSLTPGQIATLILRTAQACYYYRLSADRVHIVGHSEIDDCERHYCPGFSPAEWSDWVEAVYQVCKVWRGW